MGEGGPLTEGGRISSNKSPGHWLHSAKDVQHLEMQEHWNRLSQTGCSCLQSSGHTSDPAWYSPACSSPSCKAGTVTVNVHMVFKVCSNRILTLSVLI